MSSSMAALILTGVNHDHEQGKQFLRAIFAAKSATLFADLLNPQHIFNGWKISFQNKEKPKEVLLERVTQTANNQTAQQKAHHKGDPNVNILNCLFLFFF